MGGNGLSMWKNRYFSMFREAAEALLAVRLTCNLVDFNLQSH